MGLQRAGFDVVGVDINPQPHHRGGHFVQADALAVLQEIDFLLGFDFIWASPPCQRYSACRAFTRGRDYPDLVDPVRELLEGGGRPWVIENVLGAPLRRPALLCGLALGLRTKRHRYFEASFPLRGTECPPGHPGDWVTVCGGGGPRLTRLNSKTPARAVRVAEGREAMGIDWMPRKALSQAIPPAYAEWIGRQALEAMGR